MAAGDDGVATVVAVAVAVAVAADADEAARRAAAPLLPRAATDGDDRLVIVSAGAVSLVRARCAAARPKAISSRHDDLSFLTSDSPA